MTKGFIDYTYCLDQKHIWEKCVLHTPIAFFVRTIVTLSFVLGPAVTMAQDDIEVMSVFAPGSGGNYVTRGKTPAGLDSQVRMYDTLPRSLAGLDESGLANFFKPAKFDVEPDEIASEISPRPGLRIVRDRTHNVPHIFGESRAAAMFGVGYVRAEDRLWQMDSFRAQWRAESAAFLGRGEDDSNVQVDANTFRLIDYSEAEYQRMFDNLRISYGYWGIQAASDIEEYVAGFNAYLDNIETDPSLLPIEYVNRNIEPRRWSVTDVMAMAAYSHVSWGSAGPGEEANAQLLRQLQRKFGSDAQNVFNDLRSAPNNHTAISLPAVRSPAHAVDPNSIALLDLDSFEAREILLMNAKTAVRSSPPLHSRNVRSNALLVAAEHSATGRPIGVQGPQDGYGTPHLFDSEISIVAPDFKARGILELSGPYPYVAARGESYAWSITILPPDQADTFVEVLCEADDSEPTLESMHYLYKGDCLPFAMRTDTRNLHDNSGTYTLTSLRSVHGPVIGRATVDGKPVAVAQARSMYMHEEMDYPAHAQLFSPSVVRSAADFIEILAGTAYNIGWWYVDQNDIAGIDAGLVPIRADGASTDLPVWGTGEWDWFGFDPATYTFRTPLKSQYPQAINGPDGVIAGWNNPSALGWPLKDEAWNYGSHDRVQLLKEPSLAAISESRISIIELLKIHTRAAVTDYQAQRFYPTLREFIGTVDDRNLEQLLEASDAWSRDGGLLLDLDGDGFLEHGKAIAFLDSFWDILVRDVYQPVLGTQILQEAGRTNNLPAISPNPGEANGWVSKIVSELRSYFGYPVDQLSRNYCGITKAKCRTLIVTALSKAADAAKAQYGNDIDNWKVAATCEKGCRQIDFSPTGDMTPVAPISWQNRGTYIQVTTGN